MAISNIHIALRQSHLFSSLSDAQMDRVCSHAHTTRLGEGQPLFVQGDEVEFFYLVHTGRIKLSRLSPEGQEKIIEIVPAGQTFAEALMFIDQPHYPVNATALSESKIIGINASDFRDMLSGSVDTCFLLLGAMSKRMRSLIHEIDTLSLQSATGRIASYILENTPPDQNSFELGIAKNVLAARLSVKPETFSRILHNLHAQDFLTVEGSKITIHDRTALAKVSIV